MTEQFDSYINSLFTEDVNKYSRILAQLTPKNIQDARDWIADCSWRNLDPEEIPELPDLAIVRGVALHYEGGWPAFLRAEGEG